jgi:hypothetical protein
MDERVGKDQIPARPELLRRRRVFIWIKQKRRIAEHRQRRNAQHDCRNGAERAASFAFHL